MPPVWAGLVTGVVWGLWHLPAFFLGGTPQSGWDFTPFFAGAVGASLIVTAMFNASRGGLLVAMLFLGIPAGCTTRACLPTPAGESSRVVRRAAIPTR